MGQTISGDGPSEQNRQRSVDLTTTELDRLFVKKCLSQLKQIETFSIKSNLKISDLNQDRVIQKDELISLLHLGDTINEEIVTLLFNFLLTLSEFPLISNQSTGSISVVKLLKIVNLLNLDRFNSIFNKETEYVRFIMKILAISSQSQQELEKVSREKLVDENLTDQDHFKGTIINNKLSWSSIDYFKDYQNEQMTISAKNLSLFFTFCLSLSLLSIEENHFVRIEQLQSNFESKKWKSYEKLALSMVRTISYGTNSNNSEQKLKLCNVVDAIKTTFPYILSPLSHIINTLLLMPSQPPSVVLKSPLEATSIVNEYTLAQLATFLPAELCYSKMRKLYTGKEAGFSMRSFESKVMKWNAPSILFVSGSRINPLKRKLSKGAEKFVNEEYPKFTTTAGDSLYGSGNEKLTFGIYVHQPWKLSNKETFGDNQTLIFQLSPQQQLFKSSNSPGKKYVYFSTFNNAGIGFGCDLPVTKNNSKKYQPGNVSLLIDGGLEFCSFRHLGPGGTFKTGSGYQDTSPEYEDKFIISDLEVFGVGSDKEIQEQIKQWEWEKKEAEARQRVNVKNLGEERLFLEMAGLVGNTGSGGSI